MLKCWKKWKQQPRRPDASDCSGDTNSQTACLALLVSSLAAMLTWHSRVNTGVSSDTGRFCSIWEGHSSVLLYAHWEDSPLNGTEPELNVLTPWLPAVLCWYSCDLVHLIIYAVWFKSITAIMSAQKFDLLLWSVAISEKTFVCAGDTMTRQVPSL